MKRALTMTAVLAVAVVVGTAAGWQYVFAPMLGVLIASWGFATMRSFTTGAYGGSIDDPEPVALDDGRTLYWCEECGTEVLLLVRGTGMPLRHCGARMHERTEVLPQV